MDEGPEGEALEFRAPPKGGPSEGWGPEGRGGSEGWGAQNFALFFSSPAHFCFFLSKSLLVEFWWCLKPRDFLMCTFGVLFFFLTRWRESDVHDETRKQKPHRTITATTHAQGHAPPRVTQACHRPLHERIQ